MFEAWVRIPLLEAPETTLDLLYGDGAELPPAAEDVWRDDFAAVWHFEQPGAALDSTSNDVTLRPTGNEPGIAAGIVGTARRFAAGDRMCAIAPADVDPADLPFSYTLWVFVEQTNGPLDIPFGRGGDFAGDPGYNFELGEDRWSANLADSDTTTLSSVIFDEPMTGSWVQLAAVLERSPVAQFRTYANTAPGRTVDATELGSVSSPEKATCLGSTNQPFTGLIDEARFFRKALSLDEIAVEHANLARRDQFIQIGDPIVQ